MAAPNANGFSIRSGPTKFFTPKQRISPGSADPLEDTTPTLFRPLQIRGKTLRNRICVSPMCQYACAPSGSQIGALTLLLVSSYLQYALRGAALIMTEAVAVQEKARISVNCPGIWNDTQADALRTLTNLVHSQGGLFGIQLSHGGRRCSTLAPCAAAERGKSSPAASMADGGWPDEVRGPSGGSDQTWDGKSTDDPHRGYCVPHEMNIAEIAAVVDAMADAAVRAVNAGVDVIEIHAAHGYLVHQFLSPVTNHRQDNYVGSA